MSSKRVQILEAAMKCFAQKGYHATSIQEIADVLGIAKGSLYFYFKSKEHVLISAFEHYYDLMTREMLSLAKNKSLAPRERLSMQLLIQLEQIMQHQEFIVMMMNEQAIQINEEMHRFVFKTKSVTLNWFYESIIEIYGEDAKPYAIDASTIIQAIVSDYTSYMLLYRKKFDYDRLIAFLMERLDDVVQGMMQQRKQPILTMGNMRNFMKMAEEGRGQLISPVDQALNQLRQLVDAMPSPSPMQAELSACCDVLDEEWAKPEPQRLVMKGIIAYLRTFEQPELLPCLHALEMELK
ncbi:TetR/AcrR family transcriptional regulator [Paenibacillus guangzhouensis]|uniref:TetR/AcrR family transcriptional regulator n=1 Tax=Paenibacillus guangzhouensis TaxID=1473112 RepID=UPI001266EF6E|nr:TetR/AcrR family transcriptional regulator [Paenibacillus guangzhouensis]